MIFPERDTGRLLLKKLRAQGAGQVSSIKEFPPLKGAGGCKMNAQGEERSAV